MLAGVLFGLCLAPARAIGEFPAEALTRPVFVMPEFTAGAAIGIGLPLFIVTMASQNIPGMAVLSANNYYPDGGRLFSLTGFFSLLAAPFGGHAVNLAAITAAMCAGEDADPDPKRSYWAAAVSGFFYILFGLVAAAATTFIAAAPPVLIEAVAGLALIGAFSNSVMAATRDAETREAAVLTFLVTASGLSFFGVAGAFWGLIAGGDFMALMRFRRNSP